jgi:hypothetical protein
MTINIFGGPNTVTILEGLKALVPSLIALAVLIVTGLFYRWQVRLGKQKLRHDLYDRRFAVYTAFQELLFALVDKSDDEIKTHFRRAGIARSEAPFLLDDPQIQAYLDDLYKQVGKDVIGTIMLLQSANEQRAIMSDPRIAQDLLEKASRLGVAKLDLADRHLADLSQQFARFLKLTDFW